MHKNDIVIGETYLFLTTDSPARKHLEGQPFTVVAKPKVWRKFARRGKLKTWKVTRIQNDNGELARPEELGEMPAQQKLAFEQAPVIQVEAEPGWNHDWTGGQSTSRPENTPAATFISTEPIPIEQINPEFLNNRDGNGDRDKRENPCESCETGEYIVKGTHPNGQTYYECNECGHTVSSP